MGKKSNGEHSKGNPKIIFRVTPEQYEELEKLANQYYLTISEYIRNQLFNRPTPVLAIPE